MDISGPRTLDDFQGQRNLIEGLKDAIHGPLNRGQMVPHLALFGPGGGGKTTLARLIANEIGKPLIETTGKAIDKFGTFLDIVCQAKKGSLILIDEVHTLKDTTKDAMLPFLQDGIFTHTFNGRPAEGRGQYVTVIAATTDVGRLGGNDAPFVQRFVDFYIEPYSADVMKTIGQARADSMDIGIDDFALDALVSRSRATPRMLKKLTERCVNYIDARKVTPRKITISIVEKVMEHQGIDVFGLRDVDRRYMLALKDRERSAKSLASILRETEDNIISDIEPYLMQLDFVEIEHRRRLTDRGKAYFDHLNAQKGENE